MEENLIWTDDCGQRQVSRGAASADADTAGWPGRRTAGRGKNKVGVS